MTEELGLELFQHWLENHDALCGEQQVAGLDLSLFGCGDENGGSGSGGEGENSFSYDPYEFLCGEFGGRGSQGPNVPVMAQSGYGRLRPWSWREGRRSEHGPLVYTEGTRIYVDDDNNHVATYKTITFYDDGRVTRVINERVDNHGHGTRRITDHNPDGSRTETNETFETDVNEDGTYGGDPTDHPRAPESARDAGSGTPTVPTTGPGGDPGEGGQSMEEWCAENSPYVSGVEEAAETDHTSFSVDCGDLVGGPSGRPCTILEWALQRDFMAVLTPPAIPAAGGCGPFEQPGPDGDCGPASGVQTLLGSAAWIGSVQLEDFEICNPLLCDPGLEPQ
jgi:hypothetical protein